MGMSWSFRRKLVLTWLALQAVSTLIVAITIVWVGDRYITRTFDQYGQQLKPLIKSALIAPMIQRDYASVQSIADEIMLEKSLFNLSVVDANGRTLYAKSKTSAVNGPDTETRAALPLLLRLDFAGTQLGEVNFSLDMTEFQQEKNRLLVLVSGLSALSILLFAVVSGFLSKQLTGPLVKLVEAVRNYQITGQKKLFNTTQTDEIGNLSSAFFQLTDQIEEQINELKRLNDSLETRIKQRTAEVEVLLQQIRERQKTESLGNLVGSIAHELNTPIGIAVTSISHLKDTYATLELELKSQTPNTGRIKELFEDQKDAIDLVIRNLERSDQLIRDFKSMSSKVDNSTPEKVDLIPYTGLIIGAHQPALSRISCAVEISGETSLTTELDLNAYSQILDAIINNAIAHAFEVNKKAQISIRIEKINDNVRVTIADNGRGISPAVLTTLFDPFVTTQRAQGKTGLGLYLARKNATELLGGELEVTNLSTGGACFTLTFPIC